MSIDIFGRPLDNDKTKRGPQGPLGRGFNVTVDGHYDIENKKLCMLGKPSDERDTAMVQFVLKQISQLYESISNEQKELISHLHSKVAILNTAVEDSKADIAGAKAALYRHQRNIKYLSEKLYGGQEGRNSK